MTHNPSDPSVWFAGLRKHIIENQSFSDLHEDFPDAYLDKVGEQKSHLILQARANRGYDEGLTNRIISAISSFQRQELKLPSCVPADPKQTAQLASQLSEFGYVDLPSIPSEKIDEIVAFLAQRDVVPGIDLRARDRISIGEAKRTRNVALYSTEQVLECPHVIKLANDPQLLALVEQYLGATPILLNPSIWWSFAGQSGAKDAQIFHRDNDDHLFCKLFIYLTDVDMSSGPHAYVEKSHRKNFLKGISESGPHSINEFEDWYFTKLRKTDEEVSRYFDVQPKFLIGPKGSRFLVDTYGVHKGLMPTKKDRLLCQFTYGVSPKEVLPFAPVKLSEIGSSSIARDAVREQPNSYVNGMFLSPEHEGEANSENEKPNPVPAVEHRSIILPPLSLQNDNSALSPGYVNYVLEVIFDPGTVLEFLQEAFSRADNRFYSITDLIGSIRGFFAGNIPKLLSESPFGEIEVEVLEQVLKLSLFEKYYLNRTNCLDIAGNSETAAFVWPDPTDVNDPRSLLETLPFTETVGLINSETTVGSAGCLFSNEFAKYFQEKSFNYFVAELEAYGDETPASSARWGVLSNARSFKQLAENAFGKRDLPKFAEHVENLNYWQDPFRDGIGFNTLEELDQDRESHIDACREVFLACKVFCITLDQNECWEFGTDGLVASRNFTSSHHQVLFHHRTLSVDENVRDLQGFLDILRSYNPDIQLIISISPVPKIATNGNEGTHVVSSNEHSKSVLRVAVEEFAAINTGVYYFPAYEMVSRCIASPWDQDQRRLRRSAIGQIMALFEKMYITAGP